MISGHTEHACMFTKLLSICNAASQPCIWLECLLITLVHAQLLMHIAFERGQYSPAALSVAWGLLLILGHFELGY